jgi:hypothetical protein
MVYHSLRYYPEQEQLPIEFSEPDRGKILEYLSGQNKVVADLLEGGDDTVDMRYTRQQT